MAAVQPDLFGGASVLRDFHVVTAHTRVLNDGTEVFVPEHLRWNRGRSAPGTTPTPRGGPEAATEEEGQLGLFLGGAAKAPSPSPR